MSNAPRPSHDRPAQPDPGADSGRRRSRRIPPDADFELMLALRGAAHARDLRNRVVRPRTADTRPAAPAEAVTEEPTDPRDLAHPN